ncbi:VanW family protein [Pseudalkalibacillus caeni]|uniref:YoaR-like putative peptidoglycan binding domain-containing protein n=1 Tax=Exobacillus caeni TaxID=2574798 RepID=A0A5R9EWK5_9BACL|nr:VanW family protein [Pseudalkalibacillus caeni]TLS35039.1 hypothetical protein FCL54_22535 [Pseudalkalibacillus caeni]
MKFALLSICLFLVQPFVQSEDLTITHEGAEILKIHRNDFMNDLVGKPVIDHTKINSLLQRLKKEVNQEPVNAKIGKSEEILPEQIGYKVDVRKFTEQLYIYLFGSGPAFLEAPRLPIHPKVDSELLANIRTQQIGHYVTYFNSNNKERTHNIRLAAESIDSHVVFPNETFSFNKVVGKRTKEKGYLPAPVIVRGEVTEGIGGGICQVSSTLFNSVDNAGAKILQRYSHSKRVPYVPEGRDATVSWYGPDFSFKNTYNQPLLIRSRVYGGQVSISIYSSDVVNFESRKIPGASKKLPEEIELGQNVDSYDVE